MSAYMKPMQEVLRAEFLTDCTSSADFKSSKPRERCGASGNVWRHFPDDHYTRRIRRNELGRHGDVARSVDRTSEASVKKLSWLVLLSVVKNNWSERKV